MRLCNTIQLVVVSDEVLANAIDDDAMIVLLLQPAHHDHTHDTLHVPHPHQKPAPMTPIHARIRHLKLGFERRLDVHQRLLYLTPHAQRGRPPPQQDRLLALDPVHVVRERTRVGGTEEEELRRVGVSDVHDCGTCVVLLTPRPPDEIAELPGDVAVERREYARVFLLFGGFDLLGVCSLT